MVKKIRKAARQSVRFSKALNFAAWIGGKVPDRISGLVKKAFGKFCYDQKMSHYEEMRYQKVALSESIKKTEENEKPAVLILVNHEVVIYNFRLELVERLLNDGYEVHISCPYGERIEELRSLGAICHDITIDRHGMDPIDELRILREYQKLIQIIRPAVILTYTVKPNIYGGIVARRSRIPFIANITGLGTTVNNGGIKEAIVLRLYKFGLRRAQKVFFQNRENRDFMIKNNLVTIPYDVLPGSGVNLEHYCFEPYPGDDANIIFTTVGRIMKDKGTDELLEAARVIIKKHPNIMFRLIGFFDDDYEEKIRRAEKEGIIEYIGQQKDIHSWIAKSHAIIHPSYHEGMSNVLLEAAATGRPVLASDIPGCRETFDDKSGIGFKPHDSKDLINAIESFLALTHEQKSEMGRAGREKMEKEFNRQIVVEKYMKEISKAVKEENGWSICGVTGF